MSSGFLPVTLIFEFDLDMVKVIKLKCLEIKGHSVEELFATHTHT